MRCGLHLGMWLAIYRNNLPSGIEKADYCDNSTLDIGTACLTMEVRI